MKNTVVFIGRVNEKGKIQPTATGFLVKVGNIVHMVTAKHVVVDPRKDRLIDGDLQVFLNSKEGKIHTKSLKDFKNMGLRWVFHENKEVDIAMIAFPTSVQDDNFKTIPDYLFVSSDQFYEIFDIFFLSYQPGIEIQGNISPIIRSGTVSLMNDDKTFYVDAAAFPGNSGSPVFLNPSSMTYDKIGLSSVPGGFIGIIGQYISYKETAVSLQTRRVRVIFEENTGLSRVWSVSFLQDVINSESFKRSIGDIPGDFRDQIV